MVDRFFDMISRDIDFADKLDENCENCQKVGGDNLIQLKDLKDRAKTHPQEDILLDAFTITCEYCCANGKEEGMPLRSKYSCLYRA